MVESDKIRLPISPEARRRTMEIEQGLDNLARYLDGLFRIPGTGWRFGLDALIGLVPNVGDTLTSFASFYILIAGVRYGVPKITLLRMGLNIGIDYLVGTIPIVGDLFDIFWRSNSKNIELIRRRATRIQEGTAGDYLFVFGIISVLLLLLAASIIISLYVIGSIFYELFTGNI